MREGKVYLASFPKSGNTWLRIFLANYLLGLDEPVNINTLAPLFGIEREDYSGEDGPHRSGIYMVKTHNHPLADTIDDFLTPAIYIVRNPKLIYPSLKDHYALTPKDTVERLEDWSRHYLNWTNRGAPTLVVKYEEMIKKPYDAFSKVIDFLGFDWDHDRLEQSIEFSSFENCRAQEDLDGFIEKPEHSAKFFRKAASAANHAMTYIPEQRLAVEQRHGPVMRTLGYW